MVRILFICHGNICRSPMAEAIFRDLVAKRDLADYFEADSAAVSAEELGNPMYPAAQGELTRHGLPKSRHRAWQLNRADYDRFDLFVCMDNDNVRRIHRIFGDDPEGKVRLLLENANGAWEVEDPWYTGRFEYVYDEIAEGCAALLDALCEVGQEKSR